MVEMARFIKPILAITPPDLTSLDPRPMLPLAGLARRFQQLPAATAGRLRPAHDDERLGVPRPVVRDGPAQGHDVRVGDHRHLPGRQEPRHGVRPAPPLHGRDRRRVPRLGHPQGRDRRRQQRDRGARPGRSAPRSARTHRSPTSSSRAAARSAWCSRSGEEIRADSILSSLDARRTFLGLLESGTLEPSFEDEVRRFKFRGSSGKVNLAVDRLPGLHLAAGRRRAPSRRDQLLPVDRRHGAGLRRREVRPLQPQAVHRHDHPDPGRPVDGAARQARHQLLRPVRAVQAGARARDLGRPARGVRRRGDRPDRRVRPEHPRQHPPPQRPDPARHRADDRA